MSTGKSFSEVCITKGAMSEHVKYHSILQRFYLLNIQNKKSSAYLIFFCLKILMFNQYIQKKSFLVYVEYLSKHYYFMLVLFALSF